MAVSRSRAHKINTGWPISSSLQLTEVGLSGARTPGFLAASKALLSIDLEGRARRLLRGDRPIASTPAVVPANGESGPAALVGCDDGSLYHYPSGRPLARTGLDVYSSPVVIAEAQSGRFTVAFGSDDGNIWWVDSDGRPLDGFPFPCGAFVSATPCLVDLDLDGRPELCVGDWAGRFHALRRDGRELDGFPVDLGHPIWSSATAADIDGDGRPEVVVATRWLHALRGNGRTVDGFPRLLGSYTVASPIVVDLLGDARASIVVGSDVLYAFDGAGHSLRHFPVDLGAYLWASPIAVECAGSTGLSIFVGSWNGTLHEVRPGHPPSAAISTRGPIFATAAAAAFGAPPHVLAVGSWDGRVYLLERNDFVRSPRNWPTFHRSAENVRCVESPYEPPRRAPAPPATVPAGAVPTVDGATVNPAHPQHRRATFVSFVSSDAPRFQRAQMIYTIDGESRQHPSPVMIAGGRLVSLVQPLGVGRVIRYHFEGRDFAANPIRYPSHGEANFTVERLGPLPIGKLIAAVEARV